MKKRIALLLAVIMAFSVVVSFNTVNVSAAATATTTSKLQGYDKDYLLQDAALSGAITDHADGNDFKGIANSGGGIDLVLTFNEASTSNGLGTFVISLTGAEWAYYQKKASDNQIIGGIRTFNVATTTGNGSFVHSNFDANSDPDIQQLGDRTAADLPSTTDLNGYYRSRGVFYEPSAAQQAKGSLEYDIKFLDDATKAQVTFRQGYERNDFLRIPLVLKIKTTGAVSLDITQGTADVGDKTIVLSTAGAGTTTKAKSVKTARRTVSLDTITVTENSPASFKSGGHFYIDAPSGYVFGNLNAGGARVSADNLESALPAASLPAYAVGTPGAASTVTYVGPTTLRILPDADDLDVIMADVANNGYGGGYAWYDPDDKTRIHVAFPKASFVQTNQRYAVIYFKGLYLETEDGDDPSFGVTLKGKITNDSDTDYNSGVTTQEFDMAKFLTYAILYSAETAPEFYSGYEDRETAKITVKEDLINSWWIERDTTFTLCDAEGKTLTNVKFQKVELKFNKDQLLAGIASKYDDETVVNNNSTYKALAELQFNKDGNVFTVYDAVPGTESGAGGITQNKKQDATVKFWLSADVAFKGDVYVKIGGLAIPAVEGYVENNGIVKIASFKQKVEIQSKTTPIQIGYQRYDVEDVIITELYPGALQRNKTLTLQIGEYALEAAADVYFVPVKDSQMTVSGDLGVKPAFATGATSYLNFDISRESKTASAIKVEDLQVRINRTVPYGTYELNVDGSAIRDNEDDDYVKADGIYEFINSKGDVDGHRWFFATPGLIFYDYLKVETEGTNTAYTKEVRIFHDSAEYFLDGKPATMGAPTKTVDGRLFVPLRFVSEALGGIVVWDDYTRRVQVTMNGKIVTWEDKSEYYLSGGADLAMLESGILSKAFISPDNDRFYIPFRYLAYAFNIPVSYDDATKTAYYNRITAPVVTGVQ